MDRIARSSALTLAPDRGIGRLWLLVLMGLVAVSFAACGSDGSDSGSMAQVAAGGQEEQRSPAPAITGETFEHGDFSLDMHTGKPVLVNFWFPSCPPCRAEMPDLQAAYETYGEDIVFVGVQQLGLDSAANGAAFVRELGLTYPALADRGGTIQVGYEVFSYPTTVFLDADHNIARTWTGIIGEDQLAEQLDALLAG